MADQSTPDEPTAVLVVGAHDSGKGALVRALLDVPPEGGVPDVPDASYLVLRYGPAGRAQAYVPGCRRPLPYPLGGEAAAVAADAAATGDPAARPPRRVEATLPRQLLRHFALVETPCARQLGAGGGFALADAAERGGAVVFVTTTAAPLTRAELDLLAELATREVSVFFALVPMPDPGDAADPVGLAQEAHQEAVARHAPALAGARWFAVAPVEGDVAYLRRALMEWANDEALRRASGNPPLPAGGPVTIGAAAAGSGWDVALDRWLRTSVRAVSQRLAIEVAGIHLRCVQDLVFGAGRAALPESLDRELHALSLRATSESDSTVAALVHDILVRVLAGEPTEGVRRRVSAAVRRGIEDADAELPRVLLVTAGGEVVAVPGARALAALPGYATEVVSPILPPVGLAVSGDCYREWADATVVDVGAARSWLRHATRGVELELVREVERRFAAVHRSLGALIGETIDHGVLLA